MTSRRKPAAGEGDVYIAALAEERFKNLGERISEGFKGVHESIGRVESSVADAARNSSSQYKDLDDRIREIESEVFRKKPSIDLGNGSKLYYLVLLAALLIIFILVGGNLNELPRI